MWWRSVQARKSLLEECTGEKCVESDNVPSECYLNLQVYRFLRLLLAFSTEVLLRLSSNPYTFQSPVLYYSNRLASTQASQRSWIKFASNLLEREQRLMDTKIVRVILRPFLVARCSSFALRSTLQLSLNSNRNFNLSQRRVWLLSKTRNFKIS